MKKVYFYFISHPEVEISEAVPITEWDLSQKGLERLGQLLMKSWIQEIETIYSSTEKKAMTVAKCLGSKLQLPVNSMKELGEMDRSSTGFLESEEFEKTANAFFAYPEQSIRGWESGVNAQKRIVKAIEAILERTPEDKNIAVISHGGVGSLLISHLKGISISRLEDQPGQGHFFVFERKTKKLLHSWQSIS